MINVSKYLKKITKTRKEERRLFLHAKPFLKPGVYVFENKNIRSLALGDFSLLQGMKYYFCMNKNSKLVPKNELTLSTYADYSFGLAKELFLFEEYVVGYFRDFSLYIKAKTNYKNNISSLKYPVVNVIAFDDVNCLVMMERVEGVQYEDRKHDYYVIRKLLEYALESPIKVENDDLSYLQHGDVKRNNIIWTDENNFVFIDLDNVSYRPILFDVLHYCAMANMSLDEIVQVLSVNTSSIRALLSRFGLSFSDYSIDYIFCCYARFFVRLGDCYENIAFLKHDKLSSYPKTAMLLSELKDY